MSSTAASAPSRRRSRSGCSTTPVTPCTAQRPAASTCPTTTTLLDLYRKMVVARRFDVQVTALTKQGRLATYPSAYGQEACEIGAISAIDGATTGSSRPIATASRCSPAASSPATSCSRSAATGTTATTSTRTAPPRRRRRSPRRRCTPSGLAHAARLRRDPIVAMTFLGDGATSEGDAHEAFNFAAVWQTPTVFVVQNNQFAISVPLSRQTRAATLADKAVGYGMPGFHVDGNDVAAMYAVTQRRGRAGAIGRRSDAHRGRHLPHRGAHELRRPDSLPRTPATSSTGSAATRSSASRSTSSPRARSPRRVRAEITDAAEDARRRTRARS